MTQFLTVSQCRSVLLITAPVSSAVSEARQSSSVAQPTASVLTPCLTAATGTRIHRWERHRIRRDCVAGGNARARRAPVVPRWKTGCRRDLRHEQAFACRVIEGAGKQLIPAWRPRRVLPAIGRRLHVLCPTRERANVLLGLSGGSTCTQSGGRRGKSEETQQSTTRR
jgi:hypothetical protein